MCYLERDGRRVRCAFTCKKARYLPNWRPWRTFPYSFISSEPAIHHLSAQRGPAAATPILERVGWPPAGARREQRRGYPAPGAPQVRNWPPAELLPPAAAPTHPPASRPVPCRPRRQPTAAMGAGASRAELPRHRSLDCRHQTVVEFVNGTEHTVHTYWINYAGAEKRYFSLAPGATVQQPTYTSHPWSFAAPNAPPGTLCVVQNQTVFYPPLGAPALPRPLGRIECAGSLPWSPAHHPQFPPAFRSLAVALLCCHHRLSARPPDAASHACEGIAPPPKQRQRRQGRWLALWRPSRTAAPAPPDEEAAAAVGHSPVHHLGSLPKASGAGAQEGKQTPGLPPLHFPLAIFSECRTTHTCVCKKCLRPPACRSCCWRFWQRQHPSSPCWPSRSSPMGWTPLKCRQKPCASCLPAGRAAAAAAVSPLQLLPLLGGRSRGESVASGGTQILTALLIFELKECCSMN